MRLIDADKLKKQMHCEYSDDLGILEKIDEQPTAYDVNKVVKQLKERSKEFNSGLRLHGKPENMRTEEAIEIVKAGGKDD